jgi:uncharacterized tellurite resistance protein B-like protein
MRLRSLLKSIGLDTGPTNAGDPFVRRLHAQLERLGADRLEYLAGFAGQLARVAHADAGISAAEGKAIAAQLREHARLSDDEARTVVDILRHEFEELRAVQPYILNRAINNHAALAEKQTLVDCLYAVAAADHLVSDVEEQEIRKVADALMISHRMLMDIRGRYRDRIETLLKLRQLRVAKTR